jgi:hypothetical protein
VSLSRIATVLGVAVVAGVATRLLTDEGVDHAPLIVVVL